MSKDSKSFTTKEFMDLFKRICGFSLRQFTTDWVLSTGCVRFQCEFNYIKKTNSIDLKLNQQNALINFLK